MHLEFYNDLFFSLSLNGVISIPMVGKVSETPVTEEKEAEVGRGSDIFSLLTAY